MYIQILTWKLQSFCARSLEVVQVDIHLKESYSLVQKLYYFSGFTQYLLEEDCHIFDSEHRTVCQDMSHPLSHYFIASSHNT